MRSWKNSQDQEQDECIEIKDRFLELLGGDAFHIFLEINADRKNYKQTNKQDDYTASFWCKQTQS